MYAVFLKKDAEDALAQLHTQDFDWCLSVLNALSLNPFPGVGGDKEKLRGYENRYRIHIGRSYTAIYKIDKEKKRVCISYFGKIGAAHKEY